MEHTGLSHRRPLRLPPPPRLPGAAVMAQLCPQAVLGCPRTGRVPGGEHPGSGQPGSQCLRVPKPPVPSAAVLRVPGAAGMVMVGICQGQQNGSDIVLVPKSRTVSICCPRAAVLVRAMAPRAAEQRWADLGLGVSGDRAGLWPGQGTPRRPECAEGLVPPPGLFSGWRALLLACCSSALTQLSCQPGRRHTASRTCPCCETSS